MPTLYVPLGRSGETFGKGTPGNNDTGAVDVAAATEKVGRAVPLAFVTSFKALPSLEERQTDEINTGVQVFRAAMQAEEGAAKAGSIIDKIKDALPFGTLPVFDLAELSKDDADMGPNEVSKEYLGTGFQNSNNPFDTAMPGPPDAPAAAVNTVITDPQCGLDRQPVLLCCHLMQRACLAHRPLRRDLWRKQAWRE